MDSVTTDLTPRTRGGTAKTATRNDGLASDSQEGEPLERRVSNRRTFMRDLGTAFAGGAGLAALMNRSSGAGETNSESRREIAFQEVIDRLVREGILTDNEKVKSDFDKKLSEFVISFRVQRQREGSPKETDEASANRVLKQLIWLKGSKLLEHQTVNGKTISRDELFSYYTRNPSLTQTVNGIAILRDILEDPNSPNASYKDSIRDLTLQQALQYAKQVDSASGKVAKN